MAWNSFLYILEFLMRLESSWMSPHAATPIIAPISAGPVKAKRFLDRHMRPALEYIGVICEAVLRAPN